jgi:hypothetical protein
VRLACFLGCLLVAAPIGLAAQNASFGVVGAGSMTNVGPNDQASTATRTFPQLNLCPVSMQASHLADGSVVKTGASFTGSGLAGTDSASTDRAKAGQAKGAGQRLHLKLFSPDERTIASAIVNVRGWTTKGRTAQIGAGDGGGLATQTLTVPFAAGADRTASAEVWAPGLTAVVSVELLTVKYSDGSTWTPPQGKSCRVAPDLLMLVTQR